MAIDNEIRKEIASRLKIMRGFLKLSPIEIARHLGISDDEYQKLESGEMSLEMEHIAQLDDMDFDACYLLTGISETDSCIERALEVMPEADYKEYMKKLYIDTLLNSENLSDMEQTTEMDKLAVVMAELADYGSDKYDQKKLRDVPEIRFLTNVIEAGSGD